MSSEPEHSDFSRYCRQITLPEIGIEGQEKLSKTRILCVGAGGLGCPALTYLCAAGIGTLGVVDGDCVDVSNLHRQVLFHTGDQGTPKVDVVAKQLKRLNPAVTINTYQTRLTAGNAIQICKNYDILIDGTDNFAAKYLVNDVAVKLGMPVVYGSISRFEAHVSVFWAAKGSCYRCLYPQPPEGYVPNCAEAGVLGALTGVVGSMQAVEAIKLALQNKNLPTLINRYLVFNVGNMKFSEFQVSKQEHCPVCSIDPESVSLVDFENSCTQDSPDGEQDILFEDIDDLSAIEFIDVRERDEWESHRIKDARNIPLSELKKGLSIEIDKNHDRIVYCLSGKRSLEAIAILNKLGHQNLKNLKGGIMQWRGPTDRTMS